MNLFLSVVNHFVEEIFFTAKFFVSVACQIVLSSLTARVSHLLQLDSHALYKGLHLKAKTPDRMIGGFLEGSLTMTYFHTGCSTIIGAKSFHGPVRDGKGWYQLANVIRHNL